MGVIIFENTPSFMSNRIFLHGISLKTKIGVTNEERSIEQTLRLDIDIELIKGSIFEKDDLSETIDYAEIENIIQAIGTHHRYKLLESLAEEIADEIKKKFNIKNITLKIAKPKIIESTDFVGVILER
jgi:7,8-dihydroneopterin aldolase/epimerase/oxygenase